MGFKVSSFSLLLQAALLARVVNHDHSSHFRLRVSCIDLKIPFQCRESWATQQYSKDPFSHLY